MMMKYDGRKIFMSAKEDLLKVLSDEIEIEDQNVSEQAGSQSDAE